MTTLQLHPGALTLEDLQALHAGGAALSLDPAAHAALAASAAVVQRAAAGEAPVYGVNTGFGKLANKRISHDELEALQRNLIRSHSVGVGAPLQPAVVRLMLALKAASLARGFSGVRQEVVDCLLAVHNAGLVPYVPSQGSVGASGDLAPLSHMTLALMGEGEMLVDGERVPALPELEKAGIAPLTLQAKEGLALINGTQTSTALALHALIEFEPVLESALVLVREANAVTDNPLVFAEDGVRAAERSAAPEPAEPPRGAASSASVGVMISGGNFHAEPVALAADAMAVAIAEVGAIAERRIAMLIDAGVSQLPPFLSADAGLNSGFMIAHVTAASLASENKSLAHPASVDSLPTSANQEDHVSMATFAARRLQAMIANVSVILGIEWLAAAQGIEFLRPLRSSGALEQAHALLRARCGAMPNDRYLAPDIERATALVRAGALSSVLRQLEGLPTLWKAV
jgi:histidine ammonia-lyase